MDFYSSLPWQTLIPKAFAYVTVGTLVAWFVYLIGPALRASHSSKYEGFEWVKGDRSLSNFFSVAYEVVFKAESLFITAYDKFRHSVEKPFLIPFPHSNTGFMLLMPVELIGEYARQPESAVSFNKYVREVMLAKYSLFGQNVLDNNIQKPIVYRELFQKLGDKMGMMNEEMVGALDKFLASQLNDEGEMQINMWDTATKFLSRTSNRIIVGYPLCRNQEYLDATVHYAVHMFSIALYMRFIPPFLRPLIAPLVQRPLKRDRDIVLKHATPIIEERKKIIEEAEQKGVQPNLPNDLLSSAMKAARKDPNARLEYTTLMLVNRVLAFNFLQSYSNTLTLTNQVYDLISLPKGTFEETIAAMRKEISEALETKEGWTHEFVNNLPVMDSFLRESLRENPIGEVGVERTIVKKDGFTFSNGLHVPYGTTLCSPLKAIQHDSKNYPGGFNPKRSLEDPNHPKSTDIGPDFLNFGLGRPACPGRWFAANLQKIALSHLVMDYDFERIDVRPAGVRKVTLVEPCGRALITLRKRKVQA